MKERLSLVNMILKLLWGEIAFPKRFDFQSASSSKDNGRKLTDHNHHHYYYYCCCRWWYLLLGLLVLGPSISSDSLFISKYRKCYYKVWRVLQSATENPSICKAVVTSSHDCHFPGSTHKRKLKIFWPRLQCQFHCSPQQSVAPLSLLHPPTPNHERQTTTPGTPYENFFTRLISFIFIAKMGDGFVFKIYNSGVLCKCNKPIWQRSFNKPSQAIC